jgi:hypothetical protein
MVGWCSGGEVSAKPSASCDTIPEHAVSVTEGSLGVVECVDVDYQPIVFGGARIEHAFERHDEPIRHVDPRLF